MTDWPMSGSGSTGAVAIIAVSGLSLDTNHGPPASTWRTNADRIDPAVPVDPDESSWDLTTERLDPAQELNNDGFIDLCVTKGNVEEVAAYAAKDPSNLLVGQPDGTFQEGAEAAGVLDFARGRGAALADFNLDGMLDLVKVNLGAPVRLWRNVGTGDATHPDPMGNWLAVTLHQPGSNRDAIGSWIEVRVGATTMRRELTVGGGHSGGQLGPTHFGLGPASEAQIRVLWPDGEQSPWTTVKADQSTTIERCGT